MQENKWPGLSVMEEPGGMLHKLLVDHDGAILVDEKVLPHDDLIHFMHTPLDKYNHRLAELEEHPLFEESQEVSVRDYQDVVSRCNAAVHNLRTDFPEAWFLMRDELESISKTKDDGSALFFFRTGCGWSRWCAHFIFAVCGCGTSWRSALAPQRE